MKLSVVAIAAALTLAVVLEFKSGSDLLAENQRVTQDRVRTLFSDQLTSTLSKYPQSVESVKLNWRSMPLDFALFESGARVYPTPFDTKSDHTQIWSLYFNSGQSNQGDGRSGLISQLRDAMQREQNDRITAITVNFFNHLRFYKLSPEEELISRLAFIHLSEDSRWNDSVINRIVFDGDPSYQPAIYYLFVENKTLSIADYARALNLLKQALEYTAIDSTKLNQFEQSLLNRFQFSAAEDALTILETTLVQNNEQTQLQVSINLAEQLLTLNQTLKNIGIFEKEDSAELGSNTPFNVAMVTFEINKPSWQQLKNRQVSFLIIKLTFICLFALILWTLVRRYQISQQQAVAEVEMQQQFINFVGHELKTPLASIRLMSETLAKRHAKGLTIKDYPTRIVSEADKLTLMVENLLSLQTIQTKEDIETRDLMLVELIREESQAFEQTTEAYLSISINVEETASISGNAPLLQLVIRNLLNNAVKYRKNDTPSVSFHFDPQKNILSMRDNGIGIQQKDPQSVFKAFYQEQDSNQGFGLGLALSKTIMDKLGGDIRVADTDPHGTLWHIEFANT